MIAKFEKRIIWEDVHTAICSYRHLHNLPHWHLEHELLCVRIGKAELMVNNNFFTLNAGMCAFIKGEEIHYIKADADSIVDVVKIDSAYVETITAQKCLVSSVLTQNYGIKDVVAEIFAELKGKQEYSNIIADSMTRKLIAQIFRNEPTSQADERPVRVNQKYKELLTRIAEHFADITFEDAALYMNFSKPYFSKYFHRITGMTFTQYLNILKVSAAVEKIAAGSLDLTGISGVCGFGTIRNFNRVFKALTGYSPKQLPEHYVFIYNTKHDADQGFDPTLCCTEIVDTSFAK